MRRTLSAPPSEVVKTFVDFMRRTSSAPSEVVKTFVDNSKNPKNAFLCSSMNMELVCSILKGI
jgi:hypothetical protein